AAVARAQTALAREVATELARLERKEATRAIVFDYRTLIRVNNWIFWTGILLGLFALGARDWNDLLYMGGLLVMVVIWGIAITQPRTPAQGAHPAQPPSPSFPPPVPSDSITDRP